MIARSKRNISYLRYADDIILMAESEEELKSLLMKMKVESEKAGLKLNVQKMKIMASGPITSWQIDGKTVETVADYFWGAPKSPRGTPWTVAYQAPPSMGFSRQEYWSGLPFSSSWVLPDSGIKPGSLALQVDSLPLSYRRSPT